MNDEDVTPVTRNEETPPKALTPGRRRTLAPELKLVVDTAVGIAMIYYITHPDCLEKGREVVKQYWTRVVHRVSIWTAQQDIRSLPQVDD